MLWRKLKCTIPIHVNALLLFLIHRSVQEQRGYVTANVVCLFLQRSQDCELGGKWGFRAGFCAWLQYRHCPCLIHWSPRYPPGAGHKGKLHAKAGAYCHMLPSVLPRTLEKLNEHVLTLSLPAGVPGMDEKRQLQDNSLTLCFLLDCDPEQLMLTGLEHQSSYLLLAYLYAYSK